MKVPPVSYCSKCVYPNVSAIPLAFDKDGICSGCRIHQQKKEINCLKF